MSTDSAITVNGVSKRFALPHERHSGIKQLLLNIAKPGQKGYENQHVLDDISFEIKKGDFYGIVGRNGSGKSTLLKMLAGIYAPNKGSIEVRGSLTPFIELGVGFNPELTGRENVFLNGALLGFDRKEMGKKYDKIVAFAELERFMDQKLKNYSSGMQVRLAFSIAVHSDSEILVFDEVLAVGDYDFQQKCLEHFKQLRKEKRTVILVSHDMQSIRQFCTKGAYLSKGKVIKEGSIREVVAAYEKDNTERAEEQAKKNQNEFKVEGIGTAQINKVFTRSGNKKKNVFLPNETIQITFDITAKQKLDNPTFGMIFSDAAGQVVFATNTIDQQTKTPVIEANKSVTVTFEVENIFNDGEYYISGAIADSDRITIFSRVENAHHFKSMGWERTAKAAFYPKHNITIS